MTDTHRQDAATSDAYAASEADPGHALLIARLAEARAEARCLRDAADTVPGTAAASAPPHSEAATAVISEDWSLAIEEELAEALRARDAAQADLEALLRSRTWRTGEAVRALTVGPLQGMLGLRGKLRALRGGRPG
ncbi:hypothetical protein [Jannaschia sp. W003]|uniref:hypothetical protein n=1 Tax=Jannaschia sp. W003 TaxID=2867012 RepID=UPI0021A2FED0|nr:hypothetical protein [Jannaschia sp. W003]UWQ22242.1 hypothetical protein K3554_04200 [Jannaschia sp. W003]